MALASNFLVARAQDNASDAVVNLKAYAAFKAGNYEEAREIWQQLADRGNTTAMINLASLFQQGKGVEEDPGHALKYIIDAAELGDPRAQYELGIEYEKGIIVERDIEKATNWLLKSAKQGDQDGQFAYAMMLATGFGEGPERITEKQRLEAIKWFKKATDNGHPDAAAYLKLLEP